MCRSTTGICDTGQRNDSAAGYKQKERAFPGKTRSSLTQAANYGFLAGAALGFAAGFSAAGFSAAGFSPRGSPPQASRPRRFAFRVVVVVIIVIVIIIVVGLVQSLFFEVEILSGVHVPAVVRLLVALGRGQALEHDRLRRDEQRHGAGLHRRTLFDVGDVVDLRDDQLELHLRALRMHDFAATEAAGDLHLVARLDEAANCANLHGNVVVVRLGTDLDLFDLDDGLLPLGFALLLLLFVLVLAEVEDLADGRVALRIDLYEVETDFTGAAQRLVSRQDSQIRAVLRNDAHLGYANPVVDSNLRASRLPAEAPTAA